MCEEGDKAQGPAAMELEKEGYPVHCLGVGFDEHTKRRADAEHKQSDNQKGKYAGLSIQTVYEQKNKPRNQSNALQDCWFGWFSSDDVFLMSFIVS